MGKGSGSAPKAPDPFETASAQTGSNISTAIANQRLNMVDQIGPTGSVTYEQVRGPSTAGGGFGSSSGSLGGSAPLFDTITDPSTGQTHRIPRYQQVTRLSDDLQAAEEANQATQRSLAEFGTGQAGRLSESLQDNLSLDGLPRALEFIQQGLQDGGSVYVHW